jgi:hypothetical protein
MAHVYVAVVGVAFNIMPLCALLSRSTTITLQVANTGHISLRWPARPRAITTLQVANTGHYTTVARMSAHYYFA